MSVNDKIREKRKGFNPNIKGDPSLNVRTDQEGTADVPATEQKDITPKKGEDKNKASDNTNK